MREGRIVEIEGFTMDLDGRLLLRDGRPVALTPKAFDTLAALLERPGEVVGKEELLARVWPGAFVEEAILAQNIYTLRKALQEAGGARTYIETIPRRGYRFAGTVVERRGAPPPQRISRELDRLTRGATRHPEAYDAYLRGWYFWNRRTFEGLTKGIESFQRAIALDPGFAPAYAGLADCWVLLPLHGASAPRDVFPQAIAAAERALELDDSLAEAHTSLAYARFLYERRWQEAERGFLRAIDLSPGYATVRQWYAFLLSALGRHEEAVAQARQARELDPLSLVINSDLGMVLCFARDAAAEEQLRRTLELDAGFAYARFVLGFSLQQQGRLEEAVAELGLASSLAPDNTAMQAAFGQALAWAGRREEARQVLARLEERSRREPVEATLFAFLWTALGERDRALDLLEAACDEGARFVAFLATWWIYDPLRSHPRWPALLQRAGMVSPASVPVTLVSQ
jgi:DNA-binding winged helix-turn-helix (wHTH) protein/Tfp pilus assembly protein PilF